MDPHASICYSGHFKNELTGLYIWLNNCSACYIAKLVGSEAETGKEGKIQENSISSTKSVHLHRRTCRLKKKMKKKKSRNLGF